MNGCLGMPTYRGMPSGRTPRNRLATMPKSGCSDRAVEVGSGRTGVLPVSTSIEPSLCADIVWCSDRIRAILSPSPAWSGKSSQTSRPGTGRRDGAEGAAILVGGVGLGVVGLELARAAPHPEEDDRGVGVGPTGGRPRGEQVGEAQAAEGERAEPEELPASERSVAGRGGHGVASPADV